MDVIEEKIIEVLQLSDVEIEKLQSDIYDYANAHFSLDNYSREIYKILKRLIKE